LMLGTGRSRANDLRYTKADWYADVHVSSERREKTTLRMPVKSSSMLAVSGLGSVCTILSFSRSETRHEPWKKSGRLQYASGSARKWHTFEACSGGDVSA